MCSTDIAVNSDEIKLWFQALHRHEQEDSSRKGFCKLCLQAHGATATIH